MKIRRSILSKMKLLQAVGRGRYYENALDDEVLFSALLENGRVDVYLDGFMLCSGGQGQKIYFAEVTKIDGFLSSEYFSEASRTGNTDFYLPLEVTVGCFKMVLSLPFLSYSSVLIILVGLRDEWLKACSEPLEGKRE